MKKAYLIALVVISTSVILSGCTENNNDKFIHGNANIENLKIEILKTKVNVTVKGYLPDGCTEFDKTISKRENNVFHISISTIKSKNVTCENLPYFFEKVIPIETYGLNTGRYYVTVNGVNSSFEIAADSSSSN